MVQATGRYLHHNFVATLLNDLFGVQARAGCACAGPYAQHLLGISYDLAKQLEDGISQHQGLRTLTDKARKGSGGKEMLRPGFCRVSFHYSATIEFITYVTEAVRMVAKDGWKLLPLYTFNPDTAEWEHRMFTPSTQRMWLSDLTVGRVDADHASHRHRTAESCEGLTFVCQQVEPDQSKLSASEIASYQATCLSEAEAWFRRVSSDVDVSRLGLQAGGGQRNIMAAQRGMFDQERYCVWALLSRLELISLLSCSCLVDAYYYTR